MALHTIAVLFAAWPACAEGPVTLGDVEERLKVHVYTLAEKIGERNNAGHYPALLRARDYVAAEFGAAGYTPDLQEYTVWNSAFHNVVAVLPGAGAAAGGGLVVGAHYDTAEGTPGADDNASGTAALLEVARLLKAGPPPRRNVTLVAFSTEEPPYFGTDLMGSRFFAAQAARGGARPEGMICLETIGFYSRQPGSQGYPPLLKYFFPETGDFIALVGNFRSRGLLKRVREGLQAHMALPVVHAALPSFIPGVDWSDHRSFWVEGIPAVMLTDTAPYRNLNYHRHTDTYETLDYKAMAELTAGVAETVRDLAK